MHRFEGEIDGVQVKANQYGISPGRRLYWRAESSQPLTDSQVATVQEKLGFHPAGYGISRFTRSRDDNGQHVTVWFCWDSCE